MTTLPPLPDAPTLTATRGTLHRLAEGTLAAAQMAAIGTIRLQVTPDGFATRTFADPSGRPHRLLVRGADLVREYADGQSSAEPIAGPFDAGAAAALYAWWELGWAVLTGVVAGEGEQLTDVVLWPEHFDAGTTLTLADGRHLNLGFSPGDDIYPSPYVYAGPWEAYSGPFWNAPFGVVRSYEEIAAGDDPAALAAGLLAQARELYGGLHD